MARKKSGHTPVAPNKPKEFSSLKNQDKLGEGLLRTSDGKYVPMDSMYMLRQESGHIYFRSSAVQDRLDEGHIKFVRFVNKERDKPAETQEIYLSGEDIRKMKGSIYDPSGGCFVATAVYGDPGAPQVQALRDFRDTALMEHPIGRSLVDLYYSGAGKRAANFISEYVPSAIPVIRRGLDIFAGYVSRK